MIVIDPIDASEIKIDVPKHNFVKLTHLPTGFTVTKHNKSQQKAYNECIEELEMLIGLYQTQVIEKWFF